MRRGAILQYAVGGQRLRVVVVTADRYSPDRALIAPLRERVAPQSTPAFLVPLNKTDWPTAALIDLSRLRSADPSAIAGSTGQLTAETIRLLDAALRTYLGMRA